MQYTKLLKISQVHNDDISNVLILNKKAISNQEHQLFQSELEKFRPHQNRLMQATHKQNALMKELTKTYGMLLQDRRVKSEQAKYESFNRQRNAVLTKYKKIFNAFNDLINGLMRAQSFYSEMKDTVESLEKNMESFVNNRRSEGAQLLQKIEQDKASNAGSQADRERDRLQQLMERMAIDPAVSPTKSGNSRPAPPSRTSHANEPHSTKSPTTSPPYYSKPPSTYSNGASAVKSPVSTISYQNFPHQTPAEMASPVPKDSYQATGGQGGNEPYNPMIYPFQSPTSPPRPPSAQPNHHYLQQQTLQQQNQTQQNQFFPQGYVPPPPPPGPPPTAHGNFGNPGYPYPSGPGGYAYSQLPPRKSSAGQGQNDPWAGLSAWK